MSKRPLLSDRCVAMEAAQLEILVLAVLLDILIGDPQVSWHPVALIGRMISWWEGILYRKGMSPGKQRLAGVGLVILCVLPVLFALYFVLVHLKSYNNLFFIILSALLLWSTISVHSLNRAAREILGLLKKGDLKRARDAVRFIVGRDTDNLDEKEIARATVETVAENISDGIIAPLFYFLIGGAPLACAYRVINTLDSMVGYRNERYLNFGWFAARLDDVANFIPARLTTLLLFLSAFVLRANWRGSIKAVLRDSKKHPSPNSGYPEAAVAGALGIQLGGVNYYGGKPSFRALLGDPLVSLNRSHIESALYLMYGTVAIFFAGCVIFWLFGLLKGMV